MIARRLVAGAVCWLLCALPALAASVEDCEPCVDPVVALDLRCLREAYPEAFAPDALAPDVPALVRDDDGRLWLQILAVGEDSASRVPQRILYDDGVARSPAQALLSGTVRESMADPYPLEPQRPLPGPDERPGRVRSLPLLQALYGEDEKAVRRGLVSTHLHGAALRLSRRAGVSAALARVDAALAALAQSNPARLAAIKPYLLPLGGGFFWRPIRGEKRLSPHSFGMALDLNPRKGAYWRWSGGISHPEQALYPQELVAIFEDAGFIWGGKWREYDLMHFEYRPELICKARALAPAASEKTESDGAPGHPRPLHAK